MTSWLKLFGDYVYLPNTNSFVGSKTGLVRSVKPALSFLFIHSSPVPDPIPPHVSCFRCSFCFMSPALNPVLNPKPRSLFHPTSHHIPLFYFHPYAFCLNPCPFPSTLLCSFRYLYVNSFLYVPQSEIDINCPC